MDPYRHGPAPPRRPPRSRRGSSPGNWALGLFVVFGAVAVVVLIGLIVVVVSDDEAATGAGSSPAAGSPPTTGATVSTPDAPSGTDETTAPIEATTSAAVVETTTTLEATTTTLASTAAELPESVRTDCIPYDTATLDIEERGEDGWQLLAGPDDLLLFADEADARLGLALAANHTELCFLGRGNSQPDPLGFVHTFWYGSSGTAVPIPGEEDCSGHDAEEVYIEEVGGGAWVLRTEVSLMASFDGEADAEAGLLLAQTFSESCFIGRDNDRPDRERYIHDYWK